MLNNKIKKSTWDINSKTLKIDHFKINYEKLKSNYDTTEVTNEKTKRQLLHEVKKLTREVKDKELAIEWFKNKCQNRKIMQCIEEMIRNSRVPANNSH